MKYSRTLEILIPTHNRTESVIDAIATCLAITDPRLSVRCNSNGFDSILERFRRYDERLNYDCFERNRGILANMLFLLSNTDAKYAMLLSDEDRVTSEGANKILDFLDAVPDNVAVVSCSIFDSEAGSYYAYSRIPDSRSVDINEYLLYGLPVPSYISGLIFSVDYLHKLKLKYLYAYSVGNAYPHLDVVFSLLEHGFIRFYSGRFVIKGPAVTFGGEGFEHRKIRGLVTTGNLDLNPLVYGPKARSRQYYYQEQKITLSARPCKYSKFIAKLYNFVEFYTDVRNSSGIVLLGDGCDIRQEAIAAKNESIASGEWSGSLFAMVFIPFVKIPWPVGALLCGTIKIMLRVHRLIIWLMVIRSKRLYGAL